MAYGDILDPSAAGAPDRNARRAAQAATVAQQARDSAAARNATAAAEAASGSNLESSLSIRDKYNAAAEARMFQSLSGAWGSGGGGDAPPVSRVGGPIAEKEAAARAAAFARAKESAGNNAQAALAGLRNTLGRRGFQGGGGYADMRTAEALAPAANQVNEFTREQQIQDLNSAGRNADTEYGGAITQRGQTLSAEAARRNSLIGLFQSGRGYY